MVPWLFLLLSGLSTLAGPTYARPDLDTWTALEGARPDLDTWTALEGARPDVGTWAALEGARPDLGTWAALEGARPDLDTWTGTFCPVIRAAAAAVGASDRWPGAIIGHLLLLLHYIKWAQYWEPGLILGARPHIESQASY